MQTRYDQLYKAMLSALLRPVARVEIGREIPGHVRQADLWVEPDSARAGELARLGMLGAMIAQGPCLIEPFSWPPSLREARTCVLEQYTLDHALFLEAERESRPEPPFPRLWIISAGRPETLLREMAFRAMEGWPLGFWQRELCDAFHLVVTRDLPRTPDTLFLRLLSRGPSFIKAVRELAEQGSHEAERIKHVLVAFRREIFQDSIQEDDIMETMRDLEEVYAEWEKEVRGEGRREGLIDGRREGLIEGIEALCSALNIEMTAARRHALASWNPARLEAHLAALLAARRWPGE